MTLLQSQEQFENDIWTTAVPASRTFIVYFTASWCSACKQLNLPALMTLTSNNPNITWYKCDLDINDYTPAYCDVRKIPTFLCIRNKQIVSRITSSINQTVADWLQENVH